MAACRSTASRRRTGSAATGVRQQERPIADLPLAAHEHLARADGLRRLPDAGRLSRVPHHALMAAISRLCPAFGLHERITFGTAVMRAEREEPGRSRSPWRTARPPLSRPRGGQRPSLRPPLAGAAAARRHHGRVLHAHDCLCPTSRSTLPASLWSWSAWATVRWTSPASCRPGMAKARSVGPARSLGDPRRCAGTADGPAGRRRRQVALAGAEPDGGTDDAGGGGRPVAVRVAAAGSSAAGGPPDPSARTCWSGWAAATSCPSPGSRELDGRRGASSPTAAWSRRTCSSSVPAIGSASPSSIAGPGRPGQRAPAMAADRPTGRGRPAVRRPGAAAGRGDANRARPRPS